MDFHGQAGLGLVRGSCRSDEDLGGGDGGDSVESLGGRGGGNNDEGSVGGGGGDIFS